MYWFYLLLLTFNSGQYLDRYLLLSIHRFLGNTRNIKCYLFNRNYNYVVIS